MDTDHARLCLLLHSLPRLKNRQLRHLLVHFNTPAALLQAAPEDLLAAGATAAALQDLALARRHGRHPQAAVDITAQLDQLRAARSESVV